MQRNNPEVRNSHLLRGGSLKSRKPQRKFTAGSIQTLDTHLAAIKEQNSNRSDGKSKHR